MRLEEYKIWKDDYSRLSAGIGNYNATSRKDAIRQMAGEDTDAFCLAFVAQYARMDGTVHSDFSHRERGYYNPEDCCSVMADRRNDQAIRLATRMMGENWFRKEAEKACSKLYLKPKSYKELTRCSYHSWFEFVIGEVIINMHKTNQQSMVGTCLDILKEDRIVPVTYKTSMWMV